MVKEIQLGRIYKRNDVNYSLAGYPRYMVLTSIKNVIEDTKEYTYIDLKLGEDPDNIMPDYAIQQFYELVEHE